MKIGDRVYATGKPALSPDGRTNLTFSEARNRAALAENGISLASKEESKAAKEAFKEQDLRPDMVGRMANKGIDAVNSVTASLGGLFGWSGAEIDRVTNDTKKSLQSVPVADFSAPVERMVKASDAPMPTRV